MRVKTPKTLLAMSFFLLIAAYTATGKVIYVDADAQGPVYDGSSWTTAFEYLQEALAGASSGDEIRVAQGIYKPHEPVPPPPPDSPPLPPDRTATFQLINGVIIKGGYAGLGEPDPDARDVQLYETILSGDLNGDDGPEFANNSENSYHVTGASNSTNATAVLDGFTITGSNANGDSSDCRGGGFYTYAGSPTISNCTFHGNVARGRDADGGGLFCYEGSPTVTNCTFITNSADDDGGGMSNYSGSPTVTNCTFTSNTAGDGGGGFRNYEGNPTLTNCTFITNSAAGVVGGGDGAGGGMCNHVGSPAVINCRFIANSAGRRGGGMSNYSGSPIVINCKFSSNAAGDSGGGFRNYEGNPIVANCTFIGNIADDEGGGLWNYEGSPIVTNSTFSGNEAVDKGGGLWNYNGNPILTNCILWDNTPEEIYSYYGAPSITYSDVEGGWPGEGNIDADPLFAEVGYWDADGIWVDGDYRLRVGSPCIDAGTDAGVYEDIEGNVRPFDYPGTDNNGQFPDFDMGAYEAIATPRGELLMRPRTINRGSRGQKILAVVRIPEPIVGDDIDMSEPLVLYPGAIEATEQNLQDGPAQNDVRIHAVFDRAELLAAIPDNGDVEVTIAGRFISGEYFYCTDGIKMVSSQR